MGSLANFAKKNLNNIVKPFGQTDVLLLYAIVGEKLKKYLKDRELASKIWLPSGNIPYVIKRGSKLEPLLADELTKAVTVDFLKIRSSKDLASAKNEITDLQKNVWQYFVPRKFADFFYATNHEGVGNPIDRIFFDLDRGKNVSVEQAQETVKIFVQVIEEDRELEKLLGKVEPFICWTGSSFHVFIFLDQRKPSSFYEKYFQYSKNEPESSFTGRWARKVSEETKLKVTGGHEKKDNCINIDPSQTPSGKLCRIPLGSLHMKDAKTVDGVSIPITKKMIEKKNLARKLTHYTARDVIENLEGLAKILPKKFR